MRVCAKREGERDSQRVERRSAETGCAREGVFCVWRARDRQRELEGEQMVVQHSDFYTSERACMGGCVRNGKRFK